MDIPPSKTPLFGPYEIAFLQSIEKTDERQSIVIKEKKRFKFINPKNNTTPNTQNIWKLCLFLRLQKLQKATVAIALSVWIHWKIMALRCGDF